MEINTNELQKYINNKYYSFAVDELSITYRKMFNKSIMYDIIHYTNALNEWNDNKKLKLKDNINETDEKWASFWLHKHNQVNIDFNKRINNKKMWSCNKCNYNNFMDRTTCRQCHERNPNAKQHCQCNNYRPIYNPEDHRSLEYNIIQCTKRI